MAVCGACSPGEAAFNQSAAPLCQRFGMARLLTLARIVAPMASAAIFSTMQCPFKDNSESCFPIMTSPTALLQTSCPLSQYCSAAGSIPIASKRRRTAEPLADTSRRRMCGHRVKCVQHFQRLPCWHAVFPGKMSAVYYRHAH